MLNSQLQWFSLHPGDSCITEIESNSKYKILWSKCGFFHIFWMCISEYPLLGTLPLTSRHNTQIWNIAYFVLDLSTKSIQATQMTKQDPLRGSLDWYWLVTNISYCRLRFPALPYYQVYFNLSSFKICIGNGQI